jgi:undecaprenyl-diphosphatase
MGWLQNLDHAVLEWFASHRTQHMDFLMSDLSALGGRTVLSLVVLFTVGLLLSLHRARSAAFLLAAALGGAVLSQVAKELIERKRPPELYRLVFFEKSPSFPSGHSMVSAIVYLTLALIAAEIVPRRRVRYYLVCSALLLSVVIGVSRLYLGVHYLTDVLAGWTAGLAWALLCRWLEAHWVLRAERRDPAVSQPDP